MLMVALVFGLLGAGVVGASEPPPAKVTKEMTLDLGGLKLELVQIPAGKFMMGSPLTEKGRPVMDGDNEQPHEVTISKGFFIGKFTVTQEQYEKVMGKNPSTFKGAKNPVETVSWNEAQEFCKKLSALSGKTVRLPTEAEWEYACRAGTTTPFNTGGSTEKDADAAAWYLDNANHTTHPVGQKKPNNWGLYDMHGNVYQWCQDWYGKYPAGAATDPQGPANGEPGPAPPLHVLRGGAWNDHWQGVRSAWRDHHGPMGTVDGRMGIRVVVNAP
jgi:formylglycine-generating enzyme required for sulfatase activity